MRRYICLLVLLGAVLLLGTQGARADSIDFHVTGTLYSVYVGQGDPVIPDAATGVATVNYYDPWTLDLTFTPGAFAATATVNLDFDGYSFSYDNSTPGTVEFFTAPAPTLSVCPDDDCSSYMNLYFTGNLASPDDLPTASLAGDVNASPAPFEFLRYFPGTGDDTDLQGSIDSASVSIAGAGTVPEPASLWLLATGLLGLGGIVLRRRAAHGERG